MFPRWTRSNSARPGHIIGSLATALVCAVAFEARAAEEAEIGTVAAVEGTAEIGRAGTWGPAAAGSAVHQDDELRTGRPGQMRVVFRDDTVLNLGEDTRLTVDEQIFSPEQGLFHSTMKLLGGKVRAVVGEYYSKPGAGYEVETVTAVAGVRGTEFIVSYDPVREVTQVIGIEGRVEVRSSREQLAHSVFITSGHATQIDRGELPRVPRLLDEPERRRFMNSLDLVTVSGRSLAAAAPVVAGNAVPAPDRAPAVSARSASEYSRQRQRDVSDLLGQPAAVVERTAGGARIDF